MARNHTISNPPQRHIWRSPRHKARRRRRRLARLASSCLGLLVLLMAGWMLRPAISVALAALPEEIPVLLAQPQSRQKLLEVEYLGQGEYPTGCESVTAVMALRHAGYDITVTNFIDFYLPKGNFWVENGQAYGDDPNQCFVGDPYSSTGFGCYAPALEKALAEVAGQDAVENLTGASLEELCTGYIDQDIPVILCARPPSAAAGFSPIPARPSPGSPGSTACCWLATTRAAICSMTPTRTRGSLPTIGSWWRPATSRWAARLWP